MCLLREHHGGETDDKVCLRSVGLEVSTGEPNWRCPVGSHVRLEPRNEILTEVRGLIVIISYQMVFEARWLDEIA